MSKAESGAQSRRAPPTDDVPETVTCATCGCTARYVCVHSQPDALIYNYRCRGECREGGNIAVETTTDEETRLGPVFNERQQTESELRVSSHQIVESA